jgi:hypothetical protein
MLNTKKMKHFVLYVVCLLAGTIGNGQETTLKYQSTSAVITNPERGWYDQYSSHSGGSTLGTIYKNLKAVELRNNREKDRITLILRLFYLHEFLNENAVSVEYLAKMQADFDSIRAAGIKCIVRFAYSASQSAAVWDATPEKVFSHIESLRTVLVKNSDVIAGVQAGFIGAWGEWYYTKNFAGQGYIPDATDQQNRITLVENLLKILPDHIVVDSRTPAIMKNLAQDDKPISESEAFSGSFKSRIGHHNDCFVSSASDYGTYTDLEKDLAYLHETTKYTITGGETCNGSNIYSDCANSVSRLEELHWTYLNRGYNKDVYDKWQEQNCYDEIDLSLGYRLRLVESTLPDSADQGTSLNLSFTFSSEGYAAPTQYKPIQVVLIHSVTGVQTVLNYTGTNDDIRYWLPGEIKTEGLATIPENLPDGNYSMHLRFPDKSTALADNPAYSIQLANAGIWNPEKGQNSLCHILSVGTGGEGMLPATPSGLEATTLSETEINLIWKDNADNETGFEIMRAEGNIIAWEDLITINPDTEDYTDENLNKGTFYHYIIRSINQYGFSPWADSATALTLGVYMDKIPSPSSEIYPNPLRNSNLTIRFPDNSEKHIVIRTISGARVLETSTSQMAFQINREVFTSGIYFITLHQSKTSENQKLIVL